MMKHKVVTESEWIAARQELLAKEKELAAFRDEVTRARQQLPWRRITESYTFQDSRGTSTLAELFGDRSQLIVYHFMFGPGWEEGCPSCSFWADQYDVIDMHIGQRDVALVAVSRADWREFEPFRRRMGWHFRWVSSAGNSFNRDFNVSFPDQETGFYNFREGGVGEEMPGLSVFYKDEAGEIFHTYSTFSRGLDPLNVTYQMLDLVPRGRDEQDLDFPMAWVRHHDRY
ncbi:MAG: DUF899 domain-containing protein [Pseudomonadota bacterium]